jgi:hypothetical protein
MSTKAQDFRAQQQREAKPPKPKQPPKRRRANALDTALPGVSASDRKARVHESGSRNEQARSDNKGGAKLEASNGKASRKSTRKSVGRVKRSTNLQLRAVRRTSAPKSRAAQAAARAR